MHQLPIILDVLALATLALFATVGAARGLLRGVLRIVAGFAAVELAVLASPRITPSLERSIGLGSTAAHIIAIVVVAAVLLLGFVLLLRRIDPAVEVARLGMFDRVLGSVLGVLMGATVVLGGAAIAMRYAPRDGRLTKAIAESYTGRTAEGLVGLFTRAAS